MRRASISIFIIFVFGIKALNAQITVAIADFKNQTDTYYLDSWERSIPEFLKSELSRSDKIVVVERRQLEAILSEQALSMTGLVDSSTAQKVGTLLGAEFVITGTINQSGKWTRIDAKMIRISTGQVKSEKVQAPNDQYLNEMVSMLGNNLTFILSGDGNYRNHITLKKYPTVYFAAATAGLGIATLIVNNAYDKKLKEYQSALSLSDFDETYDAANNLNKTRTVLAALTGVALVGTIYCWIQDLSPDQVLAKQENDWVQPSFYIDFNGNVYASVSIGF